MKVDPRLVMLAAQELPAIIGYLKGLFAKAHPGEPEPSSEDVIATYQALFASSLATDEAWLAAHPTA